MIINSHFKLLSPVTFEYVRVTQLPQATINCSIVLQREDGEHRHSLPSGVAYRLRKAIGNITKFSVAHPICVAWVGSRVVCVECPPASAVTDAQVGKWRSLIEINVRSFHPDEGTFFDGQYVYNLIEGEDPTVIERNYGVLKMSTCRDLYHLNTVGWGNAPRACFAYQSSPENWVVTAPCTTSTGTFIQLLADDSGNTTNAAYNSINEVDRLRFVNLRFVNYAAGRLANIFNFEAVEPLGLPLLMIEHGTFNLGELTTAVQSACPAPLKFSQALAWLIGLHTRVADVEQFATMKEIIKMLMSKGCTRVATPRPADTEGGEATPLNDLSKNSLIIDARQKYAVMPLVNFEVDE